MLNSGHKLLNNQVIYRALDNYGLSVSRRWYLAH